MLAEGETVATRKFTSRDIIDAMERNGYRKANGTFVQFKGDTNEVYAACAIGQALLNLGVNPEDVAEAAEHIPSVLHDVYQLNDQDKWSLKRIVREIKTWDLYTEPVEVNIPDSLFIK